MAGGISFDAVNGSSSLAQTLYALAGAGGPAGANRVFDVTQYLNSLFFPEVQSGQGQIDPAFFVEINALSILQQALAPAEGDSGGASDALTQLILGRFWPSVWPSNATTIQPTPIGIQTGSNLIGQILNTLA